MTTESMVLKKDIVVFKGKLPSNLLIDPIVSNSCFLDDGHTRVLLIPKCIMKRRGCL